MTEPAAVEPMHSTIAGVELVTIPLSAYAELLDCWRQLQALRTAAPPSGRMRRVKVDTRSRLFDDTEVTDFLAEVEGTMRLSQARQVCIERFGEVRAPSRATIGRFWQRRRGTR